MASKSDLYDIKGFDELNKKLKTLPDKLKRREVLKIQRKIAKPIVKAYADALPKRSGALAKSVKAGTVPARKVGGNPSLVVRPYLKVKDAETGKGKYFQAFTVIKKGSKPGSRKRESRKGLNTVADEARDKAIASTGIQARQEAAQQTAKYIQKQIDRLSK